MKSEVPASAHTPRFAYDCGRCKFSWCCGPVCHCHYTRRLPEPPRERQDEVDRELVQIGLAPQFRGDGASRR